MRAMQAFSPAGASRKIAVTSAGVLEPLATWPDGASGSLSIGVRGSVAVFVRWGDAAITCTEATGHWCPPGQVTVFEVPASSHLYLVTEAGLSSVVQMAQGRGL
jgi:hypothetical protein